MHVREKTIGKSSEFETPPANLLMPFNIWQTSSAAIFAESAEI